MQSLEPCYSQHSSCSTLTCWCTSCRQRITLWHPSTCIWTSSTCLLRFLESWRLWRSTEFSWSASFLICEWQPILHPPTLIYHLSFPRKEHCTPPQYIYRCLQKFWALDIYQYINISSAVGRFPLENLLPSQSNVDKHVISSIYWAWISSCGYMLMNFFVPRAFSKIKTCPQCTPKAFTNSER